MKETVPYRIKGYVEMAHLLLILPFVSAHSNERGFEEEV